MNAPDVEAYSFGPFVLVPRERQLRRGSVPIPLAAKAFDVLLALVRNHGRLVTKEALLEEVWPGVVVEEVNLTVNISAIRKALGVGGSQDWIETVPRHGYRFRGDVKAGMQVAVLPATSAERAQSVPRAPIRSRRIWTGLATLAVCAVAFVLWWFAARPEGVRFDSVAVLPFVAESRDYEDVADGLTEETINRLASATALRIAPRTSAFRFKGGGVDAEAAARALGVRAVVTGRVALRGESFDIQVDLVDALRNAQIWGERYRGTVSDLPSLEGKIAQDILRTAGLALSPDQTRQLSKPLTQNADAYRAYLKGRFNWNQRTEAGLKAALAQFERAASLDPRFAAAYSGYADALTTLGFLSYLSPAESFPVAERYARRAIEIDPSVAEAHASLAYVRFYYYWDWPGAEAAFKRSLELNPRYAVAHQWYSIFLLATGRSAEGFKEILLAQESDPLSLAINTDVGFHHYYNRRYDSAVKQLTAVLEMKSEFPPAHLWLGRTYQELKKYSEALEEYRQVSDTLGDWPVAVAARGYVNAVSGRTTEARDDLANLREQAQTRFVTAYGVALVHAGLGEKDLAFTWLEKAFAERSHWLVWLRLDPRWDAIRADPGFEQLLSRVGLPSTTTR
jgi:DNA-binding winged helix-turn-helix (wHTH) protein/TolB-like protein/Tfp pilus assembly protein PilF